MRTYIRRGLMIAMLTLSVSVSSALAATYEDGLAVFDRGDDEGAYKIWRPLAEHGDAKAQFRLGLAYNDGIYSTVAEKNLKEAVRWFSLSAAQGNAEAQRALGTHFRDGAGVKQDFKEAIKWFRLSSEQGDAEASFYLAVIYKQGRGVRNDFKEALNWYRLAAQQGYPISSVGHLLGYIYREGQGVPQDYIRAHMWWNIAAADNDDDAGLLRDQISTLMTTQQIAEAQAMARKCEASHYKQCD